MRHWLAVILLGAGAARGQQVFHVAVAGDDARGNGTIEAPFASPGRALRAAREWRVARGGLTDDLHILLGAGTYALDAPLRLEGERDGGTAQKRVVIGAAGEGRVVLSGGREVGGWVLERRARGQWRADVQFAGALDLFMDGRRLTRARFPSAGWLALRAPVDARTFDLSGAGWIPGRRGAADPAPEAVARRKFVAPRAELSWWRDARFVTRTVFGSDLPNIRVGAGQHVFLEGARAFLDAAGEWHFSPAAGASPARIEAILAPGAVAGVAVVPRLQTLLFLDGTTNVHVRDVEFAHAARAPTPVGYNPQWGAMGGSQDRWGELLVPAAVRLRGTVGCTLDGVTIEHTGGYGVWIESGRREDGRWVQARDNAVLRSRFSDLGAGAIGIGPSGRTTGSQPRPPAEGLAPADWVVSTRIEGCVVNGFGHVYLDAPAIQVRFATDTMIRACDVGNGGYCGIAVGWSHVSDQVFVRGTTIEANRIHAVMRTLSDGAAVYARGAAPGSLVAGNVIDVIVKDPTFTTNFLPAAGLYFDQGSTGWTIRDNVIRDTPVPIFFNTAGSPSFPERSRTGPDRASWGPNYYDRRHPPMAEHGAAGLPPNAAVLFDLDAQPPEVGRLERAAGPPG